MYPSFTGTSRRPRQVNLSGRQNANPFAAFQQPAQNAVAHAQLERKARQAERDRLQAARTLQRTWRGFASREALRTQRRKEWDDKALALSYQDSEIDDSLIIDHLKLLLLFASPRNLGDVKRICHFLGLLEIRTREGQNLIQETEWTQPLSKLSRLVVTILSFTTTTSSILVNFLSAIPQLLRLLLLLIRMVPKELARFSEFFYVTMSKLASSPLASDQRLSRHTISQLVALPLTLKSNESSAMYAGFLIGLLPVPGIEKRLDFDTVNESVDQSMFAKFLRLQVCHSKLSVASLSKENLEWLLAHSIQIHRAVSGNSPSKGKAEIDFIAAVSRLLSLIGSASLQTSYAPGGPGYVQEQISSLVSQRSIKNLFSRVELESKSVASTTSDEAATIANYILTLLQIFPRQSDEIRMWLFLGSTSAHENQSDSIDRLPAIKYLWSAVAQTDIFGKISSSPRNAAEALKSSRGASKEVSGKDQVGQEWRFIILFMELYTFVMKIMDDEEFMNGSSDADQNASWTRQSALSLTDVRSLTVFLKNFAFAMYCYSTDIQDTDETSSEPSSLAHYFGHSVANTTYRPQDVSKRKTSELALAGIQWITLRYLKEMITGLLRMLYDRDSRRNFLPPGHWLMKEIEIREFISAVVADQRYRDDNPSDSSDENEDAMEIDSDFTNIDEANMVGTERTQRVRRIEVLKQQQQRAARKKQSELVLPRLQILQNMPFFIPFTTRVEIFREFIALDQYRRRNGFIDADQWRMSVASNEMRVLSRSPTSSSGILERQSARVRRDHVFEDAFEQFYELGEGLKEPIQITFVDQFDNPEAGIDGGGVTKEFLTSVTKEAFTPNQDVNLFSENDQHLFYPNPTVVDEQKLLIRQTGVEEETPLGRELVRNLLKQYEFLGRVVGKCLYEGILVDVHFAPFFLIKWSLTGGIGSATNESSYRASINDLRDLDEELYQGLLKLKNYPGDIEDFGLDFTVTDNIPIPRSGSPPKWKSLTRELRRDGAVTPVTTENRLVYISYMARHRLQIQPHLQTSAFLRGLSAMIQPSWLSMFNQSELQTLLGGDSSEIDVGDLRRNTIYGGVYVIGDDGLEHPTVKMFWEVMQDFSDEDRRKVLKYVTSTPRGPLLGFGQLNPAFSIRDSGSDQTRLPSASTCVNLLKLPIYSDKATLAERLTYAVNAGAGFNLS